MGWPQEGCIDLDQRECHDRLLLDFAFDALWDAARPLVWRGTAEVVGHIPADVRLCVWCRRPMIRSWWNGMCQWSGLLDGRTDLRGRLMDVDGKARRAAADRCRSWRIGATALTIGIRRWHTHPTCSEIPLADRR